VKPEMSSEEKLWLLALARGPLSPTSLKRHISDQLRDRLVQKGLARQHMELLEITREGASLANELIRAR
jgi:hypothetical protein